MLNVIVIPRVEPSQGAALKKRKLVIWDPKGLLGSLSLAGAAVSGSNSSIVICIRKKKLPQPPNLSKVGNCLKE